MHSRRYLLHLEHSPVEWHLIEDLVDVLQPFKNATTYLSSGRYLTLSVLGPLLMKTKKKVEIGISDSVGIRCVKRAIAKDLDSRYKDPDVQQILNKACLMKTLPHLSANKQEMVLNSLTDEIVMLRSNSILSTSIESNDIAYEPSQVRKQLCKRYLAIHFFILLKKMERQLLQYPLMNHYKAQPLLNLDEHVGSTMLHHTLPYLTKMARKYLSIIV